MHMLNADYGIDAIILIFILKVPQAVVLAINNGMNKPQTKSYIHGVLF
jgi:hypothetical protein